MLAPADWRKLYPFASQTLDLDGQQYHYVDEGEGKPILFVHGNPTWSFYWRNLITAFRGTHRTLAVDHIGCGLSDKPQNYEYTLEQHIENLTRFLERLELKNITLAVHDWGGAIGLGAAVRQPERFERLILFNTGAFPPPYVPYRIAACRFPVLGNAAMRGLNLFARAAVTMATEKPERMTPEVKAGLLAPYDNWANRVAIARFVQDIPLSTKHPTYATLKHIEQHLPDLENKPIQMIWGAKDWCFTTECLQRFQTYWPQAESHVFADCGHYVVEDAHERIVPLVESFLQRTAV